VSVAEFKRQLQRLEVGREQEVRALEFAERLRGGLEHLDLGGKQELLRLLVEEVTCAHDQVLVRTIIPLTGQTNNEQLCTPALGREGGDENVCFATSGLRFDYERPRKIQFSDVPI
jgi:hypothetical protein